MITESKLAAAYKECLPILDAQKAAGVPFLERIKGLEAVLRQFWPFRAVHHFNCERCADYGLELHQCDGEQHRCGLGKGKPHLPHEYGTPCWCVAGARFKARERTDQTMVEAAATVKKPTRFGR
jgi:hypothetical protein